MILTKMEKLLRRPEGLPLGFPARTGCHRGGLCDRLTMNDYRLHLLVLAVCLHPSPIPAQMRTHIPPSYQDAVPLLPIPLPSPPDLILVTKRKAMGPSSRCKRILASSQKPHIPGKKTTRFIIPTSKGKEEEEEIPLNALRCVLSNDLKRDHVSKPCLTSNIHCPKPP